MLRKRTILSKQFRPVTRAEVFIWENFDLDQGKRKSSQVNGRKSTQVIASQVHASPGQVDPSYQLASPFCQGLRVVLTTALAQV